jgi:hypothetical protein
MRPLFVPRSAGPGEREAARLVARALVLGAGGSAVGGGGLTQASAQGPCWGLGQTWGPRRAPIVALHIQRIVCVSLNAPFCMRCAVFQHCYQRT